MPSDDGQVVVSTAEERREMARKHQAMLANFIVARRSDLRLHQTDLAARLDMKQNGISGWENPDSTNFGALRTFALTALEDALELPRSSIFEMLGVVDRQQMPSFETFVMTHLPNVSLSGRRLLIDVYQQIVSPDR